jgi:hypothetical protein
MLKKEKIILRKSTKKHPFFGFSSILIAHLFGKQPLFPKPVQTSTEQIPNKTLIKVKKNVKCTQT